MSTAIDRAFTELVELRYQLYNGLFLTLPLDAVEQTGVWLPLLHEACESGLAQDYSPEQIITGFFASNKPELSEREQIDFLFKIIQYVERQIVLIDALEDSAYGQIHRISGPDSWSQLTQRARAEGVHEKLAETVARLGVRVVLTAHPTQFYPETVLAIIGDLTEAITNNRTAETRDLLDQLGRTPFFRKKKPSPFDEAMLLMNYLSQVFYPAVGQLLDEVGQVVPEALEKNPGMIRLGFWPGGDRDGNPFVTVDVTRNVARKLKEAVLACYREDLRQLRRRLSFGGVYERLLELEDRLDSERQPTSSAPGLALAEFRLALSEIARDVETRHQGLFLPNVQSLQRKLDSFGYHFASLDLRQDSRVIAGAFDAVTSQHPDLIPSEIAQLPDADKIEALLSLRGNVDSASLTDPLHRDLLDSIAAMREIQGENGEAGAHRFIISNCRGPLDIARLYALFLLNGWDPATLTVDLVPLFETIDDLRGAAESMRQLYESPRYREHLARRGMQQTVMLGFSDGTKDGGYLMANWAIHTAKEEMTAVSRAAGVTIHFFDGRGGPPARGGGNSHLFYAAQGGTIESRQTQLTLQGQTISSHYGIQQAAAHNLERLMTAGQRSRLFPERENELTTGQRALIEEMAELSYKAYQDFKDHPLFVPYLLERSPMKHYGMANIGSRPSKRGASDDFRFEDLRAIPFVGAWSQLKQNVPGFYGFGTALNAMRDAGRMNEVKDLFANSNLFRTFVANSMQSMSKTNFALTRYMAEDERFGEFWRMIHDEFELTRSLVLEVSGQEELLEDNPRSQRSIRLRERVVLPLLTLQQYALIRIQQTRQTGDESTLALYESMVMRSLFGNINAARNSV